jgi:predicted nucleotidyltransferase/uncharacterized protein (UPF0332 family)
MSPSKKKNSKKSKANARDFPTLKLVSERDIAMDFAEKTYEKFGNMIKSIILLGSTTKQTRTSTSDIDVIIIVDDATVKFDQELVAWYREELGKILQQNPYKQELHINTVKLTTWWNDLITGDPIVINVIRYGEALLDFGGYFNPLKILLQAGKIKPTPEAIYTALQRAPQHLARSRQAELSSIEGIYWAMVDSAHALLIASKVMPPSPEHVPLYLKENFVDKRLLDPKYIAWYRDVYSLHRGIIHGDIKDVKGQDIDLWQIRADEFIRVMAKLIEDTIR